MPAEVCRTVFGSPVVRDFRKALSAVPTDIPTGKLSRRPRPCLRLGTARDEMGSRN
jgi:hypothetical protein